MLSIYVPLILTASNLEKFVKSCCLNELGVSFGNLKVMVLIINLENLNFCDYLAQKLA